MREMVFPLLSNLYLLQIFVYVAGRFQVGAFVIVAVVLILTAIVLSVVSIMKAVKSMKNLYIDFEKQKSVSFAALTFKLAAIPFYILNFIVWLPITGAFIAVPGLQIFLLLIPIAIGFTYLILLAGSSHSIAVLDALRKNGKITNGKFLIHVMCQLIFVVDVIDQIIILRLTKKSWNSNEE